MDSLNEFLQKHIAQMSQNPEDIAGGRVPLDLDFVDEKELVFIAERASCKFCREESLLKLTPPLVVVGDIHGQILDLYRIFTRFDLPPKQKYLFLGDIVDRGEFSIEAVSLIFVLKIMFPNNVFVIRGNHEFKTVSSQNGFLAETLFKFGSQKVFDAFQTAFNYLPIGALIGKILCIHGGICPEFTDIQQISKIQRPFSNFGDPLICGILWSDPSNESIFFCPSKRGHGSLFGKECFIRFLEKNNLSLLIRAHECVDGIKYMFDDKILSVFSASNYPGGEGNKSGVLFINDEFKVASLTFPPLPQISLKKAANGGEPLKKSFTDFVHRNGNTQLAPVLEFTCGAGKEGKLSLLPSSTSKIRRRIVIAKPMTLSSSLD